MDYYPLSDLVYRTVALTDDPDEGDVAVVEAYDTDAYGNTLIFNDPGDDEAWFTDDDVPADAPLCPFIFTGRRYDPETGIYFYRARYYHQELGRFLSRDPLDYLRAMCLHEYALSAPCVRQDWSGLSVMMGPTSPHDYTVPSYNPNAPTCDPGRRSGASGGEDRCCGALAYDPQTHVCCKDGVVRSREELRRLRQELRANEGAIQGMLLGLAEGTGIVLLADTAMLTFGTAGCLGADAMSTLMNLATGRPIKPFVAMDALGEGLKTLNRFWFDELPAKIRELSQRDDEIRRILDSCPDAEQ